MQEQSKKLNTDTISTTEGNTTTRLVIVHDVDADGICAAWCIHKGFKDEYPEVLLVPQRAGDNTIPEGLTDQDSVFMVDRTYPWDTLLKLSEIVFDVTVIDHHKSAMLEYKEKVESGLFEIEQVVNTESSLVVQYANVSILIDTKHAACMLAYHYVMEHGVDPDTTVEVPFFVQYIEDRDMWWFKLPNSKEINAGMHLLGFTFTEFDKYCTAPHKVWEAMLLNIGSISIATTNKIVKSLACGPTISRCFIRLPCNHELAQHDNCTLYEVVMLCCPFSLISDLGNFMLKSDDADYLATRPEGVTPSIVICYNAIFTPGEPHFTYGIRSTIDMIWLAKKYGGGGHALACGFKSDLTLNDIMREFVN